MPVLAAFAAFAVLALAASAALAGAQPATSISAALPVQWSAGIGFDSFGEQYSIEEGDTLDFSNEVWTRAGLLVQKPWSAAGRWWAEEQLSVSNLALRNRLALGVERAFRVDDALSARSDLTLKRNHPERDPDDALALASGYWQEDARVGYRPRVADWGRLRLGERFFVIDFSDNTHYEYDYFQNELSAGFEVEPAAGRGLDADYVYARRSVPDSSAIDYQEHRGRLEYRQTDGLWGRFELAGEAARRQYRVEAVRPGSTIVRGEGALALIAGERFEVRIGDGVESTDYDTPSTIYFDQIENRLGIGIFFSPGPALELGIEPRYTVLRADLGADEDYDEWSVVVATRVFSRRHWWIDVALEPGHRDYLARAADSIYSDYDFVRGTVLGSLQLGTRTTLNGYLSYEPERHEEPGDDATITLISTDLAFRF